MMSGYGNDVEHYIVFDPSQVKSADPVTYDDQGNVIPLSKRFALGTKLLIGRSFTQELDIDGYAKGNVMNADYTLTIHNGEFTDAQLSLPTTTGQTYDMEWNYLTLGAKSSTSFGTGISLTYKYKSNFSWRIFADYDYSEKNFTLTYDPFHFMQYGMTDSTYLLAGLSPIGQELAPMEYKRKKEMNRL